MYKASDNIAIQHDAWTWQQQYKVKNITGDDKLVAMVKYIRYKDTTDYTKKMPSSKSGSNVEHINDQTETSGITFKIWHATCL